MFRGKSLTSQRKAGTKLLFNRKKDYRKQNKNPKNKTEVPTVSHMLSGDMALSDTVN